MRFVLTCSKVYSVMKGLTERQTQVLNFIQSYSEANMCPPTVREISQHFQVSLKAIQDHIAALRRKGYLSQSDKKSRSLRVLKTDIPSVQKTSKLIQIPLLGTVAAGRPLFCEENYESSVSISNSGLASGQKYFALHVRGTSMINAGILNGDLAIIRQCETAADGEIVVALIDDSVTLKRFFKEPTRIRLQAENPDFMPIYCQDVRILGVLSQIIRTY